MSDVMQELTVKARDHGRLPVHWSVKKNAGFSAGKLWMKVNDDFKAGMLRI